MSPSKIPLYAALAFVLFGVAILAAGIYRQAHVFAAAGPAFIVLGLLVFATAKTRR